MQENNGVPFVAAAPFSTGVVSKNKSPIQYGGGLLSFLSWSREKQAYKLTNQTDPPSPKYDE